MQTTSFFDQSPFPRVRPTSVSESGAVRSVAETAEDAGGLAQSAGEGKT